MREKESIICVRVGYKNPSLVIICHHWVSLVMSICDHWVRFFQATLTVIVDSYTMPQVLKIGGILFWFLGTLMLAIPFELLYKGFWYFMCMYLVGRDFQ